jgi:hypothetical protein
LATQFNASRSSQARIALCASREADSTVTREVTSSAGEGILHGERDCAKVCGAQATIASKIPARLVNLPRQAMGALWAIRRSF